MSGIEGWYSGSVICQEHHLSFHLFSLQFPLCLFFLFTLPYHCHVTMCSPCYNSPGHINVFIRNPEQKGKGFLFMHLCLPCMKQNLDQNTQEDITLHLIGQNGVICTLLQQWDLRKQVYAKGNWSFYYQPWASATGG